MITADQHNEIIVLSLSDVVDSIVYSSQIKVHFPDIDLVLSCGDLPYYYPDYVVSMLNAPLFYVRGNHDKEIEYHEGGKRSGPPGGVNLHRKAINYEGLLLAGVEGSIRYTDGPFRYTQNEMWFHVLKIVPRLLMNRLLSGRYLDIFVTHAPPKGIHDLSDFAHQGMDAFLWLINVFKPAYHFHGHSHVYKPDESTVTNIGDTTVINTYGYRKMKLKLPV